MARPDGRAGGDGNRPAHRAPATRDQGAPRCLQRTRRRLTEAERDARRQADRERIDQAARALLTSEGWQRWIRVRATNGLSRYSLRNQWLIACECHARGITPTYVAGFRAFLALNRCVRKGETAIRILAPVAVKQRDDNGEETSEKRIFFRTVPVFDVSQTDPLPGLEPVPLTPPAEPIDGDSHQHLIVPLQELARETRLPRRGPRPARGRASAAGATATADRSSSPVGPPIARSAVLVHELAHALGLGYRQYGRDKAEVLVDCVTYVVCSSTGLDVGGESIPYVAGWGEDGALDAIREYAETIDSIAHRIEDALDHGSATSAAASVERAA